MIKGRSNIRIGKKKIQHKKNRRKRKNNIKDFEKEKNNDSFA